MSRRLTRRPRAVTDIIEIADYIAADSPEAAERFLAAAEATFQGLLEMPGLGKMTDFPEPEFTGMRSWAVRGFPKHLVFYRETSDGVEIVRVIHGARDLPRVLAEDAEQP